MIAEVTAALLAYGLSLACGRVTAGSLAKIAAVKKLIDQARKTVTVSNEEGEKVTLIVDEFVYDNGEIAVDFSIRKDDNGELFVLTKAEGEILAKAEWLTQLTDSTVEISNPTWRACIRPILKAIKAREGEIRKSPTRKAKRL